MSHPEFFQSTILIVGRWQGSYSLTVSTDYSQAPSLKTVKTVRMMR